MWSESMLLNGLLSIWPIVHMAYCLLSIVYMEVDELATVADMEEYIVVMQA